MIDIVLLLALFSFAIIIIFTIYLLNSKEKRKIILKLPNHIQRDGIDQLQKANDPVFMKDPSIQFKQMNVRKAKLVNEEKQESQSHHRKGNNWQNNLNIPSSISNYGNKINYAAKSEGENYQSTSTLNSQLGKSIMNSKKESSTSTIGKAFKEQSSEQSDKKSETSDKKSSLFESKKKDAEKIFNDSKNDQETQNKAKKEKSEKEAKEIEEKLDSIFTVSQVVKQEAPKSAFNFTFNLKTTS